MLSFACWHVYLLLSVQIDGVLKFDPNAILTDTSQALMEIRSVDMLTVSGAGAINGMGQSWWQRQRRPHMLLISRSDVVRVLNLRF